MFEQVSDGLGDYISQTLLAELLISDEEAVTKWFQNEDNREKIMQRPVLLQYLQESAKINSEIRRISMDKTYSANERQKDIYQLQQRKQDMAKEYLEMLEDMKGYLTNK